MNGTRTLGWSRRTERWRFVPGISMPSSSGFSRGSADILVKTAQHLVSSATADPRDKPEDDDRDERPLQLAAAGSCLVRFRGLVGRRHQGLRSIIAAWSERMRVRWELEQMSKDGSHLIDDIGLTRRQVETEIAKPFWQA